VISHLMSFIIYALHEVRALIHVVTNDEPCRLALVLSQDVQQLKSISKHPALVTKSSQLAK